MARALVAISVGLLLAVALVGCGGEPSTGAPEAGRGFGGVDSPSDAPGTIVAFSPTDNAELREVDPTGNHFGGVDGTLYCGRTDAQLGRRRVLMRFDLSSIPTTAAVSKAVLIVFISEWAPLYEDAAYSVHRSTRTWNETTVTWNSNATFCGALPIATKTLGHPKAYTAATFNITSLAQNWVATPSRNFGCMIRSEKPPELIHGLRIASRHNTAESYRPRLRVTYTVP
jgi:hypothetical protein